MLFVHAHQSWRVCAHELRVGDDGEAVARQPGRVGVEDPDLVGPSIIVKRDAEDVRASKSYKAPSELRHSNTKLNRNVMVPPETQSAWFFNFLVNIAKIQN